METKWLMKLVRRRLFIVFLLLLQLGLIIHSIVVGGVASAVINTVLSLMSIFVCIYIISKKGKGSYKLTWVFLIMLVPMFGGLFYLIFTFQSTTRKYKKLIDKFSEKELFASDISRSALNDFIAEFPEQALQAKYLEKYAGFPIYSSTRTEYLSPGEKMHSRLLEELKKAKEYIFLEYFIVNDGEMWNSVLDILKEKVKEGVKVRLIYDDFGCFFYLPKDYDKYLAGIGIETVVFNPFRPLWTTIQNNRDHRKITVIDGKVAFTGGINLADEYINRVEKFGHWKDASVCLEGEAAWSFTVIFLKMWGLCKGLEEDYSRYYPWKDEQCTVEAKGYVLPYADSPMDEENLGENVYLQIINNAKRYLYINTPYLILDECISTALCLAAKSGVDVRIVTPHKWDKWAVHMTTRSYYRELIDAGVRIYEYSGGFIHSKTFVSDDVTASVGTTNLDFRSLYLHFECGALMFGTDAVKEVKEDFLRTLDCCEEITAEKCKCGFIMRIFQEILRVIAPLM